jgi:preprotein translocase subunit YajC
VPEPFLFALADGAGAVLGMILQAAGDASSEVVDGVSSAVGQAGDVAGQAGGEFDPLTGDPITGGAIDSPVPVDGQTPVKPEVGPSIIQTVLQNPLLLLGGLMLLFYVMVLSPERRKQAEVVKKRAALKKNDRVVTTGGILGTVVSTNADSDEITLRVDETTNTRIRVLRSAIGTVLDSGKDKSESSGKSENGLSPSK